MIAVFVSFLKINHIKINIMEHLEFVDKLNEFGIQIRSNKRENNVQKIEIKKTVVGHIVIRIV
jgi:hypothetical protein